jgi:uncharacterized protein YndB with AHSA1/START domain
MEQLIAKAAVNVDAPSATVWDALVNPEAIKQYMFGANVVSDWHEGSSITWKGQWEGKPYEDNGTIRKIKPERLLQYTHFSPLSGLPDRRENHHTVTITLSDQGKRTHISLEQDNNPTEQARAHSEKNWGMMLTGLKQFVEQHG